MSLIPGTNIGAPVVPYDTADNQASHKAFYGLGGLRTEATTVSRNAIMGNRLEEGMIVYVQADATYYKLLPGFSTPTVNGDWAIFNSGGGGGDLVSATIATASGATAVTTNNSAGVTFSIPVTGVDVGLHTWDWQIDANSFVKMVATGDGVGGITGAQTQFAKPLRIPDGNFADLALSSIAHPDTGWTTAGGNWRYYQAGGILLRLGENGEEMVIEQNSGGGQPHCLRTLLNPVSGLQGSTEVIDIDWNLSRSETWNNGSFAMQRSFVVRPPTLNFLGPGTSTITNAATVAIQGAPFLGANIQITRKHAFWIQQDDVTFETGELNALGGLKIAAVHVAVNHTIAVHENYIGITNTAAPRTVTLPDATVVGNGRQYVIKDESGGAQTNNITLSNIFGQTIDGGATFIIDSNYGAVNIISDGSNWFIY